MEFCVCKVCGNPNLQLMDGLDRGHYGGPESLVQTAYQIYVNFDKSLD